MKALKQDEKLPGFCYCCKESEHRKKRLLPSCLQPSIASLSNVLLLPKTGLQETTGVLPKPPSYLAKGNHCSDQEQIFLFPYWHKNSTLGAWPQCYKAAPAWSTETVQTLGSLINFTSFLSLTLFSLGPLGDTHPFLFSSSAPTDCRDFSEIHHAGISFSQKEGNNSRIWQ